MSLLGRMGITAPERAIDSYPHQFSGGMRQRVMLAMGFSNEPSLLIADEPTTALDVTIQAQILDLIAELNRDFGTAIVLISHDLGVIASVCSRVIVMYGGEVVEEGPTDKILVRSAPSLHLGADQRGAAHRPACAGREAAGDHRRHAARSAELSGPAAALPRAARSGSSAARSIPTCSNCCPAANRAAGSRRTASPCRRRRRAGPPRPCPRRQAASGADKKLRAPMLQLRGVVKHFPLPKDTFFGKQRVVHAVDGVDLDVAKGETVGLVGESGCGKSTLARVVARIHTPTAGSIRFDGQEIAEASQSEIRPLRRRMQMVFQDPYASLNPRMTVSQILSEPLRFHDITPSGAATTARIHELLDVVGLSRKAADRYPHEFSGGQRQRISIARALSVKPDFIIGDEPISALDVNIQAQIINLMIDLQEKFGLTYLIIAHDLAVVRHISDRIVVLYLGKVAEIASADALFEAAAASLYALSDFGGADPRCRGRARPQAAAADRRAAERDRSAVGLPLPHPLPDREVRLRGGRAADGRASAGPFRGLPFRGAVLRRYEEVDVRRVTADEAVQVIRSGDTMLIGGSGGGHAVPEALMAALERRFLAEGEPRNITAVHPVGLGDGKALGAQHFAHEGLLKRDVGGTFVNSPKISDLAIADKIEGYTLPQGALSQLMREMAAGRAGLLTKTGLHTFVDPRHGGGRQSKSAKEDLVELVQFRGEDYLFYKPYHIDVCFIRGTTADEDGNVTMEEEAIFGEMLSEAQATRRCGGVVIVQVKRMAKRGTLPAKQVKIPGILVDYVVVEPEQRADLRDLLQPGLCRRTEDPAVRHSGAAARRAQDHRAPRGDGTVSGRDLQSRLRHFHRHRQCRGRGGRARRDLPDQRAGHDRRRAGLRQRSRRLAQLCGDDRPALSVRFL